MSESQVELDNCRACDEEREYAQGLPIDEAQHFGPGEMRNDSVAFMYRHDLPDGTKDHAMRGDGICAVCGVQVFDPAKIRRVLDQINQGELVNDPYEDAAEDPWGVERAERQWALEQGEPFPERLWPEGCRDGIHGEWVDIRTFGDLTPQRMPARCPGCNQTWEAIE